MLLVAVVAGQHDREFKAGRRLDREIGWRRLSVVAWRWWEETSNARVRLACHPRSLSHSPLIPAHFPQRLLYQQHPPMHFSVWRAWCAACAGVQTWLRGWLAPDRHMFKFGVVVPSLMVPCISCGSWHLFRWHAWACGTAQESHRLACWNGAAMTGAWRVWTTPSSTSYGLCMTNGLGREHPWASSMPTVHA